MSATLYTGGKSGQAAKGKKPVWATGGFAAKDLNTYIDDFDSWLLCVKAFTAKKAKDNTPNGNDLDMQSSHCLNLDGQDQYVDLGKPAWTDQTGDMSFFIRIRPDTISILQAIFANADSAGSNIQYGLRIEADGDLQFAQRHTDDTFLVHAVAPGWAIDTEYSAGFVRDDTAKSLKIYLDGVQVGATGSYAGKTVKAAATMGNATIGRYGEFPGQYLDGKVWDFEVFSDALTAAEMLDLHNGVAITPSPVAQLPLAEGDGATVWDTENDTSHTISNDDSETWATTQDAFHHNLLKGFRKQSHVKVPKSNNSGNAANGSALTNPATLCFNDSETRFKVPPGLVNVRALLSKQSFDPDSIDLRFLPEDLNNEGLVMWDKAANGELLLSETVSADVAAIRVLLNHNPSPTKQFDRIYYIKAGVLRRCELGGGNDTLILDFVSGDDHYGMAWDSVNDHIYAVNLQSNKIIKFDAQTGLNKTDFKTGLSGPRDVIVHDGQLFYSEFGDGSLRSCDVITGDNDTLLINQTNDRLAGLEIHNSKLYSALRDTVRSSDLDGTDNTIVLSTSTETSSSVVRPDDGIDYLYTIKTTAGLRKAAIADLPVSDGDIVDAVFPAQGFMFSEYNPDNGSLFVNDYAAGGGFRTFGPHPHYDQNLILASVPIYGACLGYLP